MHEAPPAVPHDDAETVRLLQSRRPEGLQRLLEQHGPRVSWLLKREFDGLDEMELDEAMNAAAFAVWRSARTYDAARGSLRAWFYVVARRQALRVVQRESAARSLAVVLGVDPVPPRSRPADPPVTDDARACFLDDLRTCIYSLTPMQRTVILADLDSGDVADTRGLAHRLGTTPNAISAARSMGRKALGHALVELGHFPPEALSAKRSQRRLSHD